MSRSLVILLLAIPAAVATVGLAQVVRAQRADWNLTSWYVLALGWLPILPGTVASFNGGKVRSQDSQMNPITILSGQAQQIASVVTLLLLLVPAAVLVIRLRPSRQLHVGPMLATGLVVVAALAASLQRYPLITSGALALALALLGAAVLAPGIGAALGGAVCAVSVAAASGVLVALNYDLATAPCIGLYKCSVLGVFVFGVVDNQNGLALILASGVIFIWLGVRNRLWRRALALYVFGMIAVSGARTSTAAIAVLLVLLVLFGRQVRCRFAGVDEPVPAKRGVSRAGLALAAAGVSVVGVLLPFVTSDPGALTFRGNIWLIARERLAASGYGLGLGQPAWPALVQSSVIGDYAGYSVHNQWLDVLWVAGGLGMVCFLGILFHMLRRDMGLALVLLLPVLMLGVTERIWSVARFDSFSFSYVATLLIVAGAERSKEARSIRGPRTSSSSPRLSAALRRAA